MVKATGIAFGQQSLLADMRVQLRPRVRTDSTAAVGISSPSGLGRLRHVQTHTLEHAQAYQASAGCFAFREHTMIHLAMIELATFTV